MPLTREGRRSLRQHAEGRQCIYCGRFISYSDMNDGKVGWHDPTHAQCEEPLETLPYHKTCQEAEVRKLRQRLDCEEGA